MRKICVFCGKFPIVKTKEHIIPQWLIKLTGNPYRLGYFGIINREDNLKEIHIPFSEFIFPACKNCNEGFKVLEGKSKVVITDLLKEKPLDNCDINLLFTWLDKVRIGLWLGSLYYRNPFGIEPNFYISQGAFQRDRALFIYKFNNNKSRINFVGIEGYAFQIIPNCFTLIINNFAFSNLASYHLLSKNLGLPYPEEPEYIIGSGGLSIFEKGTEKFKYPLIEKSFDNQCKEFYQAVICSEYGYRENYLKLINSNYIKKIFINKKSGIGHVFYFDQKELIPYPKQKTNAWKPLAKLMDFKNFFKFIAIQTYEFQNFFLKKNVKTFDPKKQSKFDSDRNMALKFNNLLLKKLRAFNP